MHRLLTVLCLAVLVMATGCAGGIFGSSATLTVSSDRVAVIAHRGAASLAPENTMAAFRAAHQAGADMFEIDVHLSADNVPVVIHDDTLERTTDIENYYASWGLKKNVQVSSLPLSKLKLLDAGTWFVKSDPFGTIMSGKVSAEDAHSFRGEPIPTLEETLRYVDETGLACNVEIKQIPRYYSRIAEEVVTLIGRMQNKHLVLVSSFDNEICRRVRELDDEIMTGPLCGDRIADPGRYISEIVGGSAYHVSRTVLGCNDGRPAWQAPVNAGDILSAHEYDVAVNVWTVNDRTTMERLIRADVDGIITDYPHVLREVIEAYAARSAEPAEDG